MSRSWLNYLEVTICITILILFYFFVFSKISYNKNLNIIKPNNLRQYIINCSKSPVPMKIIFLGKNRIIKICGDINNTEPLYSYLYAGYNVYKPLIVVVYR